MTEKKTSELVSRDQNFDNKTIDDVFPQIQTKFTHQRHEEPCPSQTTDDIAKCPEINEWVLNHLPLKEEQKQKLLQQLINDQLKQQKSEKNQRWKLVRKTLKKEDDKTRQHVSVKESTKGS